MTARAMLKEYRASCDHRDIECILKKALEKSQSGLYLSLDQALSPSQSRKIKNWMKLYKKGLPLSYIFKETDFFGNTFETPPGVFIPRPDTEVLIQAVIQTKKNLKNKKFFFIDFGCGSGCVGLSLLTYFKKGRLLAVDQSSKAIQITKQNARRLGLTQRVHILKKNVLDLKLKELPEIPAFITANPPYIAHDDLYIEKSVKDFEPRRALFAGPQGTEAIESWLSQAFKLLKHRFSFRGGGPLYYFFEIGFNQYEFVSRRLKNHPEVKSFVAYPDIQGYKRAFAVQMKG